MRRVLAASILLYAAGAAAVTAQAGSLDDFRPSSRTGQFDVRKTGDTLEITLRVRFAFLEGDGEVAPGYADSEYRWTQAETDAFREAFRRRVEQTWSGRWAFLGAGGERLAVAVRVEEVARLEDAHWQLRVRHYPPDAPDLPASVCGPGESHFAGGCESNDASLPWGTAELASTHLAPDHLMELEIAPVELWYASDDDAIPMDLLKRPPVWLVTRSGWSARLSGYASLDEIAAGAVPGSVRPSLELARRRTAKVRQALVEEACSPVYGPVAPDCEQQVAARVRVHNLGAYGEAPYDDRRLVVMEVFADAPMDTLAHEAGHMLGLGDEASDDYWPAGSALASPDYAALVVWYRDTLVLRHDDDGIMSRGSVVRKRHYVPFLEALEELTGTPDWRIVEP